MHIPYRIAVVLTALSVLALVTLPSAQSTYRYLRITTLDCDGEKYQELDWFAGGAAYPNPRMTNTTSNGMRIWGDNADWEITQVYDGKAATHSWLGTVKPPYTHKINLDLGTATRIRPDSIRITHPGGTNLHHFQCWVSNDTVNWELFLDTSITAAFTVRSFRLTYTPDTQAPTIPGSLTAANITSTTAGLYWQPSADNIKATRYYIYRNGAKVDSTTVTSYMASGLTTATVYRFYVTAADFAGNQSRGSDTLAVTTLAAITAPPTAPTSVTVSGATASGFQLSWTAPASGASVAGYVVYLNGQSAGTTGATSYAVPGLKAATAYRVTVRARGTSGLRSDSSTGVTATTLAAGTRRMRMGTNFWNIGWGGADPFAATYRTVAGDNPWRSDFLAEIKPYVTLRFMDFGETNGSPEYIWMHRNQKAGLIQDPMAYEWMIDLCNRENANLWICIPHLVVNRTGVERGTNNYIKKLGVLVKHGIDMCGIDLEQSRFANLAEMTAPELIYAGGMPVCDPLKPNLQLYIEYSNETWNFGFQQADYTRVEGLALNLGGADQYYASRRFHAWAALRVFDDMEAVFGRANPHLMRIDAISTGGLVVIEDHLNIYDNITHNPKRIYPDAFSPAPYFGHSLSGSDATIIADMYAAIVSQSCVQERADRRYIDSAGTNRGRTFKLIAYEGGQHVLNAADVINRNAAMFNIYTAYLDSMNRYFDEFVHYAHSGGFGSGGAWGTKETIGQDPAVAHKYRAIMTWLGVGTPGPADTTPPGVPTGLAAAMQGDTAVRLRWTASTDPSGVDGYQTYLNGFYIGYVKTTSYVISGLNKGGTYNFSLKAVDGAANVSAMSNTLQVTFGVLGIRTRLIGSAALPVSVGPGRRAGFIAVRNAAGMRLEAYSLAGKRLLVLPAITSDALYLDHGALARGTVLMRFKRAGSEAVQTVRVCIP